MKWAALLLGLALLARAGVARADDDGCPEVSHPRLLGHSRCYRFGRWDVTRHVVETAWMIGVEGDLHALVLVSPTRARLTAATVAVAGEAVRIGPLRLGLRGETGGAVIGGTFSYASLGATQALGLPAGPLLLRAEVFTGIRHTSALGELGGTRFGLVPRASTEVWVDAHWTLGVFGAAEVIRRDDFSGGMFVRSYYDRRAGDPRQ